MQLKHIFSNINIANLLLKIKKYFNDEHFSNITETIQKFHSCSFKEYFIPFLNWLTNLKFKLCFSYEKNIPLFELKKLLY